MYSLQTTVTVDDLVFHITNQGDFRMVLDCFSALNDNELSEDYRVLACLLIFYEEFNTVVDVNNHQDYLQTLVEQMYLFFNCGQSQVQGTSNYKLIDWDGDSQMICSAVNNVAHQEVRALPYLHWWTFMGYYMSIGESLMSTVISIRGKIKKHKKLDKWEKEFKQENPSYFIWDSSTVEEKELDDLLKDIWGKEE